MLPKEKYKQQGIHHLNIAETIALILNKGSKRYNVFQLAELTYKSVLQTYFKESTNHLQKPLTLLPNLPFLIEARIQGIIHLSVQLKRIILSTNVSIKKASDVLPFLYKMFTKKHEHLAIFYLNNNQHIIYHEVVSQLAPNSVYIPWRAMTRTILKLDSPYILIAHNHPSGRLHPSKHDIIFTNRLNKFLRHIGVILLDHIIVTDNGYFSFVEQGLLPSQVL